MARIPQSNRRFRSKKEIAKDLAFILNAPVSYGTKFALLKDVMSVWTEFSGKYEGCPYWTPLAMAKYAVNRKHKRRRYSGLRHEHVVPKTVVMKLLEGLNPATPEGVHEICETLLHAVVVTVEEDAFLNLDFQCTMPSEFYDPKSERYRDPWLRYNHCNIQWVTEEEARRRLAIAAPNLKV